MRVYWSCLAVICLILAGCFGTSESPESAKAVTENESGQGAVTQDGNPNKSVPVPPRKSPNLAEKLKLAQRLKQSQELKQSQKLKGTQELEEVQVPGEALVLEATQETKSTPRIVIQTISFEDALSSLYQETSHSESTLLASLDIPLNTRQLHQLYLGVKKQFSSGKYHRHLDTAIVAFFRRSKPTRKKELLRFLFENRGLSRKHLGLKEWRSTSVLRKLSLSLKEDKELLHFFLGRDQDAKQMLRVYLTDKYARNLGSNHHLWLQHLERL